MTDHECDRCKGARHGLFASLRYVPQVRQWLCAACRAALAEESRDG